MSGGVIGPVVAGVLLERGLAAPFVAVVIAGLLLVDRLMLRLERLISPEVNGLAAPRERQPASATTAP